MHRIDGDGFEADKNGAGKDGFTNGNPLTDVEATSITEDWLNDVQEELCSAIEGAGASLVKGTQNQLRQVLRGALFKMQVSALSYPTVNTDYAVWDAQADNEILFAVGDNTAGASIERSADGHLFIADTVGGGEGADAGSSLRSLDHDGADSWVAVGHDAGGGDALIERGQALAGSFGPGGWASITPPGSIGNTLNCVAHNKSDLWCAVGNSGTIITAPDTDNWTKRNPAASYSGTFNGVCYSPDDGLWVAVGTSSAIQTSPDGSAWTARSGASVNLGGVDYGNGVYIAVGTSGQVLYRSTNGTSWSAIDLSALFPGSWGLNSVSTNKRGCWIAAGGDTGIVSLDDGVTWLPFLPAAGVTSGKIRYSVERDQFFLCKGGFGSAIRFGLSPSSVVM